MLVEVEEFLVDVAEGGEGDVFAGESEDDDEDAFELECEGVVADGLVDVLPLDDLDERVDEQAQLLEERVAELDGLVEELDVLAELAGQQLHEHLPLEGRVPGLLHALQPLLAYSPHPEQLRGREVREDVVDEEVGGQRGEGGLSVEVERVLVPDLHVVVLADLELYEALGGVVLDDVGWVRRELLRASAERLVRLARP